MEKTTKLPDKIPRQRTENDNEYRIVRIEKMICPECKEAGRGDFVMENLGLVHICANCGYEQPKEKK